MLQLKVTKRVKVEYNYFKNNDKVEILKEFQDKGDENYEWVCVGDEEKGRVDIRPLNHKVRYTQVVNVEWIKHKE